MAACVLYQSADLLSSAAAPQGRRPAGSLISIRLLRLDRPNTDVNA